MERLTRVMVVGMIVALNGVSGALGARAAVPHAMAAPPCQAGQLAATQTSTSGATGHIAVDLRVRNVSTQRCTLTGYPTVVLLDQARRPLPTVLRWGTGGYFMPFNRPLRLVTLASGASAYLALGWTHIPTPHQACPAAPSLLLLPPTASSALLVTMGQPGPNSYGPIDACGGQLVVSAFEPTPFVL